MFDRVIVADWSASGTPSPRRPSADAIWLGIADREGETTQYHRTRAGAEAAIAGLMRGRVLLGCDFPMGYPTGFAARLTGVARAEAVWAWLAARITDGQDNANNRFAVAADINRRFGGGPFWGRPAGLALPDLPARKEVDYAALGLSERRAVERLVPRAQPVWKLYTTGAVGSQSLMGLPMIHRLAQQSGVSVWPFQPPTEIVIAEVYPSLLVRAVRAAGGIRDQAQVRLLARALLRLSASGGLAALLDVPPTEEGWILGAGHAGVLEMAL